MWQNKLFQFTCLPFGLSSAPHTFTKVLKPVAAHLRGKGIRCVFYLDDILIMGKSSKDCMDNIQYTIRLLQGLGFIINWGKSQLHPSQCITYLGFCINSQTMSLSLPAEKVTHIVSHCQEVLQAQTLTVRDLAQLIGRLSSRYKPYFQLLCTTGAYSETRLQHCIRTTCTSLLSPSSNEELETWISCVTT